MQGYKLLVLSSLLTLMACSGPSDSASSEIGNPSVAITVREPDGSVSTQAMALWTDSASWHANLMDAKAPQTDTVLMDDESGFDFEVIAQHDSSGTGILEVVSELGYLKVQSWKAGDTLELEAWQEVALSELSTQKVWLEESGLSFQATIDNEKMVKVPQGLILNEARFFGGEDSDYSFWKGVSDTSSAKIKECKIFTGTSVSFMDTLNVSNGEISITTLQILSGRTEALSSFDVDSLNIWTPSGEKRVALNDGRFQTSVNVNNSGLIAFDIPGQVPVCIELDYQPVQNSQKVQWVLVYPNLNFDSSDLIIKERVEKEAEMWQAGLAYLTQQAVGNAYSFTNVEKNGVLDVHVMESELGVEDFDSEQWSWNEVFDYLRLEMPDYENTRFVVYKMGANKGFQQEAVLRSNTVEKVIKFTAITHPIVSVYPTKNQSWDVLFSSPIADINYFEINEEVGFGEYVAYESGGAMSLLLASMSKYDGSKTDTTKVNFQTGGYGKIRNLFTTESDGKYLDPAELFMEPSQVQDLIDSGWITTVE